MSTARDERFMACAIEQGLLGLGRTYPNPSVGCVIVHRDKVVAVGHTSPVGGPHAEVNTISMLSDDIPAAECELFVTLEPCCSHGRTPPCSEAVLRAGFRRVVIGVLDPDRRHDGESVAILRAAGVDVEIGVLEAECVESMRGYLCCTTKKRPFVSIKYAMSLDGKLATRTGASGWISSVESREHVHHMRDVYDSIMVGKNTVLQDDPLLTCRLKGGQGRDPCRIIVDARLEIPVTARVYDPSTADALTVVLTSELASEEVSRQLLDRGLTLLTLPVDDMGRVDLKVGLCALMGLGLTSVFVEGGAHIHGALFDGHLVDRVYAFVAPTILGGAAAPSPVGGLGVEHPALGTRLEHVRTQVLGSDVFFVGDVPGS